MILFEKISFMKNNLDEYRKLLMGELWGYYEMFGVIIVFLDIEFCDFVCIFIYNEGYFIMCGYVVIVLGCYVIEKGFIKMIIFLEV